jgi:MFS family permease
MALSSLLPNTLRSLQYRNYRLFFFGQSVSLIGTWMQRVAIGWLVYRLSGSEILLGLEGFMSMAPALVMAPIGGVMADRIDRRRLLLITQTLSMFQAVILAILVLSGTVQVWQVIVLSGFLGFVHAFDIPVRQAFISEMVDRREDLGNAIALNSVMFNTARLVGPSIAGLLIAWAGEGVCFALNAFSFIGALLALTLIRRPMRAGGQRKSKAGRDLADGLTYAAKTPPIRSALFMLSLIGFFGFPYMILMPVFARDILHGDASTLGFLTGAVGAGALGGAFFLASRTSDQGLPKIFLTGAALFGISLIAFAASPLMILSMGAMFLVGFGQIVSMASCNTIIQNEVDDNMRGRVMSLYAVAFRGMAPLGNLAAGALAAAAGAPMVVIIGGIFCFGAAAGFLRRRTSIWRKTAASLND